MPVVSFEPGAAGPNPHFVNARRHAPALQPAGHPWPPTKEGIANRHPVGLADPGVGPRRARHLALSDRPAAGRGPPPAATGGPKPLG